jgi:hypothetical protein
MQKEGKTAEETAKVRAQAAEEVRNAEIAAARQTAEAKQREQAAIYLAIQAAVKLQNTYTEGKKKYDEAAKKVAELTEKHNELKKAISEETQKIVENQIASREAVQQAAEEAKKAAQERRTAEIQAIRQTQDAILALIKDSQKREIQLAEQASERQIEDLKKRLQTEKNITVTIREEIKKLIVAIETKKNDDVAAINKKYSEQSVAQAAEAEKKRMELMLASVKQGSDQEYQIKLQQLIQNEAAETETQRKIIENRLSVIYKGAELENAVT